MKGFCFMSNAFSASNEMIIWIFIFEFLYIVNYVDGFLYIEPFLHPWDETYLVRMDGCFDVFLNSVSENFIEDF